MSDPTAGPRPWWETRPFVAALILLSALPLLYPRFPPLVDLPGHMGRYRVQLDLDTSPWLDRFWGFEWAAIGNLGVDLLLIPLAPVFGLELAVKLIVLAIPPLTVAGFLWVAREVHGRIPPTALFALPFAYSHPFMFGFVNYALSIALAFLAFGLWLRLARQGRFRLRAILFVPISIIVFFAHTFGWGVLGLLCFSAEAVRQHDRGTGWLRSGINAACHAAVMALPLLFMLAWRSDIEGGITGFWFKWDLKWKFLLGALRDRDRLFDIASVAVPLALIVAVAPFRRFAYSRNLAFSALVLLAGFVLLPYMVFSSAYADMRLIPYVIAVMLLAIRFRAEPDRRIGTMLAVLGLTFFLVRLAGNTISLATAAQDQRAKLAALDHVPMGAAVLSLVGDGCRTGWALSRNSHIGAMTIVRRHGFSNDQWVMEGINLLRLTYRDAGRFSSDPTQILNNRNCPGGRLWSIDRVLPLVPRSGFDYLWLVDTERFDVALLPPSTLVWRGSGSVLYRLNPAAGPPPPATRRTASAPARSTPLPARTPTAAAD